MREKKPWFSFEIVFFCSSSKKMFAEAKENGERLTKQAYLLINFPT
jgi:hypothetical protein